MAKETTMGCHPNSWWTSIVAILVLTSIDLTAYSATSSAQTPDSSAASIIADQIRNQGFACAGPISAERLNDESTPNHTGYILKCNDATYRVFLIPNMAAQVMRVG